MLNMKGGGANIFLKLILELEVVVLGASKSSLNSSMVCTPSILVQIIEVDEIFWNRSSGLI